MRQILEKHLLLLAAVALIAISIIFDIASAQEPWQNDPTDINAGTAAQRPADCSVDNPGRIQFDMATTPWTFLYCNGVSYEAVGSADDDPAVVWDNTAAAYPVDTITADAGGWYKNLTGVNTATSPSADATNWQAIPDPARLLPALAAAPTDADKTIAVNAAGTAYELIAGVLHVPVLAGVADAAKRIQADAAGTAYELYTPVALASQAEAEAGTETAERAWSPERIRQAIIAADEIPAWQPAPVTYPVNKLVVFGGDLFRNGTGTNTATDPANDPTNWVDLTIAEITALELATPSATAVTDQRAVTPFKLVSEFERREDCQLVTATVAVTGTPSCIYLDNGATPINVTLPAATTGFIDFYRSAQATGDVTLVRGNVGDTIVDGTDTPQAVDYLVDASRVWFRLAAVATGDWRILYTDTPSLAASVIRQGGYDASTNTPDLSLAASQVASDGRFYTYYVTAAGTQTIPGLGSVTVAVDDILEYWTGGFRLISAADQIQVSDTLEGNGLPATPVRHKLPNVITAATTAACGDNLIADSTGGAYNVSVPAGAPVGCRWLLAGTPAAAANNIQLDPGVDTLLGFGPADLPFIINDASQAVLEKVTLTTWAVRF